MLFSGKENVFMCLVAFQNIFRKIFSGIWKRSWKRRRKRQNPEKPGQTQKNMVQSRDRRRDLVIDGAILRSTARSRIAIDGTISRSVDRDRCEQCFARSWSQIVIDGTISRSIDHDWCERCFMRSCRRIAIEGAISRSFSLSFSLCASPVPEIIWSENRNKNEFPWSTLLFYSQLKMISGKFNFSTQPNSLFYGKWFSEIIFTQNKHSLSHEWIDTLSTALFIDKKISHGNHIFYQALVGPTCSRRLEIQDRSLHATIV